MREWLRIVPETINFIRFHNNISIKLRTFVTFEIPIASCSDQTDSFIASGFMCAVSMHVSTHADRKLSSITLI